MAETFKLTILTGKVYLPAPTGRLIIERDGWAYEEYSDRITVDDAGNETSREKTGPIFKFQDDQTIAMARRFGGA